MSNKIIIRILQQIENVSVLTYDNNKIQHQ